MKIIDCSNGTCIDVCDLASIIKDRDIETDLEFLLPGQVENNDGHCQKFECGKDFTLFYETYDDYIFFSSSI
jgi:hypothetical protein